MEKKVNNILIDLYKLFKDNLKINNSLEYFSALLYLKFNKNNVYFKNIYEARFRKDISFIIDHNLNDLRYNEKNNLLFSNLLFCKIRNNDELFSNIISKLNDIDEIFKFNMVDELFYVSKAYEKLLEMCFNNKEFGNIKEVYTPYFITDFVSRLFKSSQTVFDPFCGSGNFLISAFKELGGNDKSITLFGSLLNNSLYNICLTNLLLHDVSKFNINNFELEVGRFEFDLILFNPPFSQKDWGSKMSSEELNFIRKTGLSQNSLGDYAYLLKMLMYLNQNGEMAIILPTGALFRKTEERVRRFLISQGFLKGIISLPDKIFSSTNVSVVIMILSKSRNNDVLFIDASKEFEVDKKYNILTNKIQDKIVDVYVNRKVLDFYSNIVTYDEIEKNDFDLSVKKYIKNNSIEMIRIKKMEVLNELNYLEKESLIIEDSINEILDSLDVSKVFVQNKKEKKGFVRDVDYSLIGGRIHEFREKKGLSIEELATESELSFDFLRRIESKACGFSLKTLVKICKALDISLDDVL